MSSPEVLLLTQGVANQELKRLLDYDLPIDLVKPMRPWQKVGTEFAHRVPRSANLDTTGIGRIIQFIGLIKYPQLTLPHPPKALIICEGPARARRYQEILHFSGVAPLNIKASADKAHRQVIKLVKHFPFSSIKSIHWKFVLESVARRPYVPHLS